ncbi:MAG TPA: hypothetical protein VII73_00080 [Caulobacteraceae bacterium]
MAWAPRGRLVAERGRLLLASQPDKRMAREWNDGSVDREALRGRIEAVFDLFLERGGHGLRLFKSIGGRTGMCAMTILSPDPGARLIGGFLDGDTFVGLRLYRRDELPFKHAPNPARRPIIDWKPCNIRP